MAGNLVLIGSAANLIVASAAADEEHKAAKAEGRQEREMLTAGRHAAFGVVLTLSTCVIGVICLYLELEVWEWDVNPN